MDQEKSRVEVTETAVDQNDANNFSSTAGTNADTSKLDMKPSFEHLSRVNTTDSLQDDNTHDDSREQQGDTNFDEPESKDQFDAEYELKQLHQGLNDKGLYPRTCGVVIDEMRVEVPDISYAEDKTFADVLTLPVTIYKFIKAKRNRKTRNILEGINCVAEPGHMVLVLGNPGAGCSSILRIIAGAIDQFGRGIKGSLTYDGIPLKEMTKKFKSDLIYSGEQDVHFPHLTVKQTLDFAIACKTPETKGGGWTRKEYMEKKRDLVARIFGLTKTYNTKVGNDFIHGISGGERRRVSLVEALCARGMVYCWDNATRGLDASTAYAFAKAVKLFTRIMKCTAFINVYQSSENIFQTFDDVTLLYQGKQIYYGPIKASQKYFEKMGYLRLPRQSTAEFLTSLTDPDGLHKVKDGYENQVPRTPEDFVTYWRASEDFQILRDRIETYSSTVNRNESIKVYKESMLREKGRFSRKKSAFIVSYFEQVRLCTIRGFQRIYGDKSYTVINTFAAVIQAFIVGSLFYNTPLSTLGAFSRSGILYFTLLYYCLMGLANVTFDQKPIVQKHKSFSLYHPSAEALANIISSFPFRLIGLTLFLIILYFLSNLRRSASAFFIVYLFLVIAAEAINSLFQMIAAACDTIAQANSINGIVMLSLSMYSTYMIQLPDMRPWFKWISFVLPFRYAFESMLNAEFHGRYMECGGFLIPTGPGYENVSPQNQVCAFIGSKEGQTQVLGDDYLRLQFQYEYKHTWRNLGIVFCFLFGYVFFKALFTDIKGPAERDGDTLIFKKGSKKYTVLEDEESSSSFNDTYAKETFDGGNSKEKFSDNEIFADLQSNKTFVWRDVNYSLPVKGENKCLLNNVSGYCIPGKVTALMGESGAGKTTLLNTLAKRVEVGTVGGDMFVNGSHIDESFERRTGYVQQLDVHIPKLSVRESLQFSARMRRPQNVPDVDKMHYVEKIIQILEMSDYADALVGNVGSGLNVEQRKKLSIGIELVAKPDLLLFLDEPTSGLDAQSAWAIVQLLKRLSNAGQAILCTIHQPSATLFEEFDRLLLLESGGQTVYFGDIGENSQCVTNYFHDNGARKCTPKENAAEYILEVIGAGGTTIVSQKWHEIWRESEERKKAQNKIDFLIDNPEDVEVFTPVKARKYATSYFFQFRYVMARTFSTFWRNTNYLVAKMMLFMVGGLYIGFTFFHVKQDYIGLQHSMFAAFIAIIISAPSMNQIQSCAIGAREIYEVRESKSNMFHWSLLVLTQYLAELPYQFVFSTIFFVSFYFPLGINFQASSSGVFFLNFCIVFQLYVVGLGLMILYISPNLQSANVIMGLVLSFLIAFCGVVQPYYLMPGFWTFMWKLSPYTYFVQNLVGIMLHEKPVICSSKEIAYLQPPQGQTCQQFMSNFLTSNPGYIMNPTNTTNCAYCLYKVGDEYLHRIGASYSYIWRNFGFFWGYILFNIGSMVVLYYLFHVLGLRWLKLHK